MTAKQKMVVGVNLDFFLNNRNSQLVVLKPAAVSPGQKERWEEVARFSSRKKWQKSDYHEPMAIGFPLEIINQFWTNIEEARSASR